jgi:hypothetical protein
MSFNIHELDNLDFYDEKEEEAFDRYQDSLLEQFFNSPEGKQRLQLDPEMGFWAAQLISFSFSYIGVSLPKLNASDVHEIVMDIFPRKITTNSPDEANDTIPELISFWQFLKRQYKLPNADRILGYLSKVEPKFKNAMNDPAKFGMAKSLMMSGKSLGFDMTKKSDFYKYALLHNISTASQPKEKAQEYQEPSIRQNTKKIKNKKKKMRKMARASRKKNKKRK